MRTISQRALGIGSLAAVAMILAGCGASSTTNATAPTATKSPVVAAPPVSQPPATTPPATTPPASKPPVSTPAVSSPAAAANGQFIGYDTYQANPARYSTGKTVLFFHAPWCPKCVETENNLKADPGAIPAGLTIVQVDYDSSTDLKAKYGVTVQHTFVQVDATGALVKKWSGSYTADGIAGKTV